MVLGLDAPTALRAQGSLADELVLSTTLHVDGDPIAIGDRLEGRLEIIARAPSLPVDADIVLVLDASGSMAGQPTQSMKDGARDMIEALDLVTHPDSRVGVVEFNSQARTLCRLVNNPGQLISCIGRVGAHGGTAIDRGILEGEQVLSIDAPTRQPGFQPVMVVLSDGMNNSGCDPVLKTADRLKLAGTRIFSVCAGSGCDATCMRQVASAAGDFGDVPFTGLPAHFRALAKELRAEPAVESFEVVLDLPEHLELVAGSSRPEPISAEGEPPRWHASRLDRDGFELQFEVQVASEGSAPVGAQIDLTLADGSQVTDRLEAPVAAIPSPTPEPSATSRPQPSDTPRTEPAWEHLLLPYLQIFE